MSARTNLKWARPVLAFTAMLLASPCSVMAGSNPPDPVREICKDIPNPAYPAYWSTLKAKEASEAACKVAIKCNTGPFGGTYCSMSGVSFCNRVTDAAKVAEDTAKIAAAALVCSQVPPMNAVQGKARYALAQAATACAASTGQVQPRMKDDFCHTLDSLQDLCNGPAIPSVPQTINVCKMPWDW